VCFHFSDGTVLTPYFRTCLQFSPRAMCIPWFSSSCTKPSHHLFLRQVLHTNFPSMLIIWCSRSHLFFTFWILLHWLHASLRQMFSVLLTAQGSFALPVPTVQLLLYKSLDYYTTETKLPYSERTLQIDSGNV